MTKGKGNGASLWYHSERSRTMNRSARASQILFSFFYFFIFLFPSSVDAAMCRIQCTAVGSGTEPPPSFTVPSNSSLEPCNADRCTTECGRRYSGSRCGSAAPEDDASSLSSGGGGGSGPSVCTIVCNTGDSVRGYSDAITISATSRDDCSRGCVAECVRRDAHYSCASFRYGPSSPASSANPATPTAAPAEPLQSSAHSTGTSSFTTPHDPFAGRSIPTIISGIIRALLGIAGALFLAMFVYGGALWMTSGSSERAQQAQTTIMNAVIGIIVVTLSYTLVGTLVRFAGSLGASQNQGSEGATSPACYDTCMATCVRETKVANDPSGPGFTLCQEKCNGECPAPSSAAVSSDDGSSGSGGGGGNFFQNLIRSGGVTINGNGVITPGAGPSGGSPSPGATCSPSACHAACPSNCESGLILASGYSREQCLSQCNLVCDQICRYIHTPSECSSGCHQACVPTGLGMVCEGACTSMCERSLFP